MHPPLKYLRALPLAKLVFCLSQGLDFSVFSGKICLWQKINHLLIWLGWPVL